MKIQYLGTGASEGIPGLFCSCPVCAEAVEQGGRNVRRRSSMLINNDLLVDITPDLWSSCYSLGRTLTSLKYVLITHEHREHFYKNELRNFFPPYSLERESKTITIFGNKHVQRSMEDWIPEGRKEYILAERIEPFKEISFGDYIVTPLKSRHCRDALIYLIEKENKRLLYANDTGFFPEETWDFLVGKKIHFVSLDCNNPFKKDNPNHMNLEDTLTVKRRMFQIGCTLARTKFYITHISHNGGLNHSQITDKLVLHGIRVAYDGLSIDL